MNAPCGCCEGTQILTPMAMANRPGLPSLAYRVGTHATFLETMKARLSTLYWELPGGAPDSHGKQKVRRVYPLHNLKTRDPGDPAIALLDSWAIVGDVLTFYQERIANEGYLRTATERRSILELARLIGYTLRPGVASTVYLAYTLDEDNSVQPPKPTAVTIPRGSRAQTVPGPGELPQPFETADELEARSEWNLLQVRLTQPQTRDSVLQGKDQIRRQSRVYLKGITTNLKQNDPLLIDFTGEPELFRVMEVQPDAEADHTLVKLQAWTGGASLLIALTELIDRHDQTAQKLSTAAKKMAKTIVTGLRKLLPGLAALAGDSERRQVLKKDILPALTKTLAEAPTTASGKKVAQWLSGLVSDLSKAIDSDSAAASVSTAVSGPSAAIIKPGELLDPLLKGPSLPPANAARLGRAIENSYAHKADINLQLLGAFQPALSDTLPTALGNAKVTENSSIKVYALRLKAAPFGNNAPKRNRIEKDGSVTVIGEWPIVEWVREKPIPHEQQAVLFLDSSYENLIADALNKPSWIVIDSSVVKSTASGPQVTAVDAQPLVTRLVEVQAGITRADYGISGKTTRVRLSTPWLTINDSDQPGDLQAAYDLDYRVIRGSAIFAQSEELELAEEPIVDDVCHGQEETIELDDVYSGLKSGQWLIFSGERADIKNNDGVAVSGVKASELVMLASLAQDVKQISAGENELMPLPGDKTHTFIGLANNLAYCYKRSTLKIYGNVVKASHGETRNEMLGGGDGSKAHQQFTLKQPPLTFVSAPTPAGAESTLEVRVNDLLWHETDSLAGLSPTDRKFITRTDDEDKTTIIFGNGQRGARLPTGPENVKAVYRNGIGKPGNVKAEQISLLVTRPLGVKAVINPLRASGGADKEDRDQARRNAPLAVLALDRLVSTQDYADFARTFAGIGKASAARLSDGRRQLVHVTIAGADDIPIESTSDLYRNLLKALRDFGDSYEPIQLAVRKLLLLVVQGKVRVLPDYLWEKVEPKIRAALLAKFSFANRELGQDALLSEAFSAIQAVEGVAFADIDHFDGLAEEQVVDALEDQNLADDITLKHRIVVRLAEAKPEIQPAELAYFNPAVPDTIILSEITA